jgi:hypothetical protein
MRTDYVIFWADEHHPVRILPMRLRDEELDLGAHVPKVLNAYCRRLQSLGLGQRVTWEASNDPKGSFPLLLAQDQAEYRAWMKSDGVRV